MLVSEVSGDRCAHNNAANAGRSREVCLPALPPGARNSWIILHSLSERFFRGGGEERGRGSLTVRGRKTTKRRGSRVS